MASVETLVLEHTWQRGGTGVGTCASGGGNDGRVVGERVGKAGRRCTVSHVKFIISFEVYFVLIPWIFDSIKVI